ncbi:uncharacterized protein FOMMEDRAFT_139003 [Fomitiporia mediterranea MF3/22]|uniref:uncharacterized protein n=1 Tax=Fomitiporia mediterranea (strain MF3/22) TaxID=694068 RepID=UPI0004408E15|nr:uncharacterized protein FOMMEDRAFT_139003 [Fomitiporia mediterranea MF3/22]EJD05598.1 hypothetical protein FOMMEDRAFT_139003 [Fomitiporia mediterranea MF3/22]
MRIAATPDPPGDIGMTPADRYYKNLRVLRRRDSHIVSIFDQFPHVTVYYMQDDLSMDRAGYEGTLFFFERDIEPTYGLFILNRQGMNDYIRYFQHDDVFEPMGEAVWISTLNPTSPNAMGDEDKTAGFWSMAMDVRETLGDMMMRLSPYIRRNERYPDEYRYGPDRVVPQQNCSAAGTRDDVKHDFLSDLPDEMREKIIKTVQTAKAKAKEEDDSDAKDSSGMLRSLPATQTNMSELDQLFSKLATTEQSLPDQTPQAPQAPLSGQALLNTMFASVSEPKILRRRPNEAGQKLTLQQLGLAPPVCTPPDNMEIISPKPSTAGLPQILTTDVIHELMGMPSSDSRSASRSSTSASLLEHPRSPSSAGAHRSKERGYIADFGEDDGGTSESSMNIDLDQSMSRSIMERLLPGTRSSVSNSRNTRSSGALKGDATPRARVEQLGYVSPPNKPRPVPMHAASEANTRSLGIGAAPHTSRNSDAQSGVTNRTVSAPSTVRVPFQSSEELWPSGKSKMLPIPAAVVDELAVEVEEVVELDFSEIGKLDDIRAFETKSVNAARGRDARGKEKAKANGVLSAQNGVHAAGPTPANASKHGLNASHSNGAGVKSGIGASQSLADSRQDTVGRSLHAALQDSNLITGNGQALNRNAFVREVLTLIHTDKKFVDKMYQAYQESLPQSRFH